MGIGLTGTLEAFDKIAGDLTSGAADLETATKQMKAEYEKLEDGSDTQKTGKMYTIIVDRIGKKVDADGGEPSAAAQAFATSEIDRLNILARSSPRTPTPRMSSDSAAGP